MPEPFDPTDPTTDPAPAPDPAGPTPVPPDPTDGGGGDPPAPTPDPTPTGRTIGDLIDADDAAKGEFEAATEAVSQANDRLKEATDAEARSDGDLAAGLAEVGPAYDVKADQTARFFTPDGAGSFHVTTAKPRSTTVGGGGA